MTEIDPHYRPQIEHSPRWFFIGRVAAAGAIAATMRSVTIDNRTTQPVEGASIIAPNHESNIDPFTTGIAAYKKGFGRIAFLAKEELVFPKGSQLGEDSTAWQRLFAGMVDFVPSQVLQRIAAHPTKRGGQADTEDINNWAVHELTRMGISVESFPQGTRTHDDEIGALKHGTAFIAIHANKTITPVGNTGTRQIALGKRRRNIVVNAFADPLHPADYISPADTEEPVAVKVAAETMTADLAEQLQIAYDSARDHRDFLISKND